MEFAVSVSVFLPNDPHSGGASSANTFPLLFSDIPVLFYPIYFYYK